MARKSPKVGLEWAGSAGNNIYYVLTSCLVEVLDHIQKEWTFMTTENCTPVQVALKLLDSSSLGLASRQTEFIGTNAELQTALKAIVNEHHQGFNSSIGTFHKIQNSLQQSQQRVRTLKESLVSAKENLSAAKPELRAFAAAAQSYDEMLQVLSSIEQLQHVPERLEVRISEKRFLPAVDVLQDALRLIRKSEMENIGALSDLRVYLSNQEYSLADILIEELHNHLYLKSPYCEDRWKAHAQNQPKSGPDGTIAAIDAGRRALYHFLDSIDMTEALVDDASRNPEADTFHYIQVILEALNKMSRLDIAVESIIQRLPVELFRVVERSNTEVAQRHPSLVRGYASKGSAKTSRSYESDETRATLLNDLLWTLYARFEAIAESHRVVHDIAEGISRRDGLRDIATLTSSFKELWKLYQSEVGSSIRPSIKTQALIIRRCVPCSMITCPPMASWRSDQLKAVPTTIALGCECNETGTRYALQRLSPLFVRRTNTTPENVQTVRHGHNVDRLCNGTR